MKHKKLVFFVCAFFLAGSNFFPQNFFDGSVGVRLDTSFYDDVNDEQVFKLGVSSFFSGNINFTNNLMVHTEMSFKIDNIATKEIFTGQSAMFWLDDISIVYNSQHKNISNYITAFIGLNEPVGSDIFLRRHFGVSNISSKIVDGWLGTRESSIYSPYGIGVADAIRINSQPMVFGANLVFTREEGNSFFAMNLNTRYAMAYRFFLLDASLGAGFPIQPNGDIGVKPFDRIYIHGSVTMLIGNTYTPSLFIQSGITNYRMIFDMKKNDFISDSFYLIIEPRVRIGNGNLTLSMFSLPRNNSFTNNNKSETNYGIFIRDAFGCNFQFFHDPVYLGGKRFTFGGNATVSFPGKNLIDVCKNGAMLKNGMTCVLSPYAETDLFGGMLRIMLQVEPVKLNGDGDWALSAKMNEIEKIFRLSVGYKARI